MLTPPLPSLCHLSLHQQSQHLHLVTHTNTSPSLCRHPQGLLWKRPPLRPSRTPVPPVATATGTPADVAAVPTTTITTPHAAPGHALPSTPHAGVGRTPKSMDAVILLPGCMKMTHLNAAGPPSCLTIRTLSHLNGATAVTVARARVTRAKRSSASPGETPAIGMQNDTTDSEF